MLKFLVTYNFLKLFFNILKRRPFFNFDFGDMIGFCGFDHKNMYNKSEIVFYRTAPSPS